MQKFWLRRRLFAERLDERRLMAGDIVAGNTMAGETDPFLPPCPAMPAIVATPIPASSSSLSSRPAAEGETTSAIQIRSELASPVAAGATLQSVLDSFVVQPATPGTFAFDVLPTDLMPITGQTIVATFTPSNTMMFEPRTQRFAVSADGRFDLSGPGREIIVDRNAVDRNVVDGGGWQISRGGMDIELILPSSVNNLRVIALQTATTLIVGPLDQTAPGLNFVGGPSIDTIRATGQVDRLDLTVANQGSPFGLRATDVEAVELSAATEVALTVDSAWLSAADPDGDGIVVTGEVDLTLVDRSAFSLQPPVSFAGQTLSTIVSSDSQLRLEVDSGYHNPIENVDVNGDGQLEPIDALLVINELRAANYHDSETGELDSLATNVFPGAFVDTNDDGLIEPIDLLLVINRLRAESLSV